MDNLLKLSICGGKEFPFEDILKVSTPQRRPDRIVEDEKTGSQKVIRDRWQPIPHGYLVNQFKKQVEQYPNLEIVQDYYTLARDGQRFFALFEVRGISSPNSEKIGTVFGLRNSHDQSCRAGICAGTAPFVCTNMVFSNEIVLGRRHTVNIFADLPQVIGRAIGKLTESWGALDRRIEAYKGYDLDDREAHHLAVEMYRFGAISKTQIATVVEQWHDPEFKDFEPRNGWSLYNGATYALRGNLAALNRRSEALHGLLDPRFGAIEVPTVEMPTVDLNAI